MKLARTISILSILTGAAFMTGCANFPGTTSSSNYSVTAYKPHNSGNVSVKVSTSTQNIYVMEGNRLLMAVQGTVGENGKTRPGHYTIFNKDKFHRSATYGFTSSGQGADAHKGQSVAVGYPMGYWCEFAPTYGFHEGFVWSEPHTHGCIRMHKQAAARFYQLVKIGTPVSIASTQPEDAKYGGQVRKLDQRNDPDPPAGLLMSSRWFQDPPGPLLISE